MFTLCITITLILQLITGAASNPAKNDISQQVSTSVSVISVSEDSRTGSEFARSIPLVESGVASMCCNSGSCNRLDQGTQIPNDAQRRHARLNYELLKLLSALNLTEKPDIDLQASAPAILAKRASADDQPMHSSDSLNDIQGEDDMEESVASERIYIYSTAALSPPGCFVPGSVEIAACLSFKIKRDIIERGIDKATLWLHRQNHLASRGNRNYTLKVEETTIGAANRPMTDFMKTVELPTSSEYISVEINELVAMWHSSLETLPDQAEFVKNFRISVPGHADSVNPPVGVRGQHGPLLELQLTQAKSRPVRGRHCLPTSPCCLVNFYVNFTEVGYRFISSPAGYRANYCTGTCTLQHTTSSWDAVIKRALASGLDPNSESFRQTNPLPGGCCRPTRFDALKITYATDSGIATQRSIPNMIVRECGC